ncbi:MAG: hypothetical protein ACK557_12880, partial [Planctomycetota bacterium]
PEGRHILASGRAIIRTRLLRRPNSLLTRQSPPRRQTQRDTRFYEPENAPGRLARAAPAPAL